MGRPFAPNIITSDKAAGGATIEKSISLNDGSSVRFHRTGTQGVDGNRRVHTVSMWMKRTVMDSERHFFSARNADWVMSKYAWSSSGSWISTEQLYAWTSFSSVMPLGLSQ